MKAARRRNQEDRIPWAAARGQEAPPEDGRTWAAAAGEGAGFQFLRSPGRRETCGGEMGAGSVWQGVDIVWVPTE